MLPAVARLIVLQPFGRVQHVAYLAFVKVLADFLHKHSGDNVEAVMLGKFGLFAVARKIVRNRPRRRRGHDYKPLAVKIPLGEVYRIFQYFPVFMLACAVTFQPSIEALLDGGEGQACALACDAVAGGQYLKKGSQVYIEGRIQSRKYTGKDGIERTAYEIIGSEMKMLGGKTEGSSESASTAEPPAPPRRQDSAAPAQPVDDIDDDIPF